MDNWASWYVFILKQRDWTWTCTRHLSGGVLPRRSTLSAEEEVHLHLRELLAKNLIKEMDSGSYTRVVQNDTGQLTPLGSGSITC